MLQSLELLGGVKSGVDGEEEPLKSLREDKEEGSRYYIRKEFLAGEIPSSSCVPEAWMARRKFIAFRVQNYRGMRISLYYIFTSKKDTDLEICHTNHCSSTNNIAR